MPQEPLSQDGGPASTPVDAPASVAEASPTPEVAAPAVADSAPAEETFFDPKTVPPELQGAYKQMQAAFTKKTQAISQARQKVEAYDAFNRDPIGSLQTLARQYGYEMTRAEAKAAMQQQGSEWAPQTWDEVLAKAEERAEHRVLSRLAPVLDDVRATKRASIEKLLDESVPEWRQYEDEMREMMTEHPTLVRDPVKLAKLAIPESVQNSRAMQAALKKLEAKTQAASMSSGSTTTKAAEAGIPDRPMSFSEAVDFAKRKLAAEGKRLL